MSWIAITEDDVLTVLAGPELEGYRAAALASGQADPVEEQILQVTNLVRGYVGGCERNRSAVESSDAGTIPSVLKSTALDVLAVRIPQRVGATVKPVRSDAHNKAIDLLKEVAACRFAVDQPESGSLALGGAISVVSAPTRQATRAKMNGL